VLALVAALVLLVLQPVALALAPLPRRVISQAAVLKPQSAVVPPQQALRAGVFTLQARVLERAAARSKLDQREGRRQPPPLRLRLTTAQPKLTMMRRPLLKLLKTMRVLPVPVPVPVLALALVQRTRLLAG
jgi:hypothetical protein